MRKAKVAALIFGGVSTCIFGGLFGVYATAPIVSSVSPKTDVENIYEVESENLANVAAVTSIKTTAVTTTSRKTTTTYSFNNIDTTVASTTATGRKPNISFSQAARVPSIGANRTEPAAEAPTESWTTAPTEAWTEAPTEYVEPTTEPVTEAPVVTTIAPTEPVTEAPTEPATEYEIPTEPDFIEDPTEEYPSCNEAGDLPISDEDFIVLCNAVAHEAGCSWIDVYDKALVVEVIMNRVYSPLYPDTITGVLTQRYQFTGSSSYVYLGTYSGHVTETVKEAVKLYFAEPESFAHGYFGFYGDGYRNYFY